MEDLLNDNFVITSTVLTKKSLLKSVGFFNKNPLFMAKEDFGMWLRISTVSDIYYLSGPLAIYRVDASDSIRKRESKIKYLFGMISIIEYFKTYLSTNNLINKNKEYLLIKKILIYKYQLLRLYWYQKEYVDLLKLIYMLAKNNLKDFIKLILNRVKKVLQGGL